MNNTDIYSKKNDRSIAKKLGNTLLAISRILKKGINKKLPIINYPKDTILIEGFVEIINGDTHIKAKNSFVDQGLITFIDILSAGTVSSAMPGTNWGALTGGFIVVGSDTVTTTTHSMVQLQNPILGGIAPGTKPNSQSIANANSNPGLGIWDAIYTSTWNPGSISGTLGEVGLYWTTQGLIAGGGFFTPTTALLSSRMASFDGKFVSFAINALVPLSITWTLRFTYIT